MTKKSQENGKNNKRAQHDIFKQAVRENECDEDEQTFNEKLRKLAIVERK